MTNTTQRLFPSLGAILVVLAFPACDADRRHSDDAGLDATNDANTDAAADAGGDGDADMDADSDGDADADADADAGDGAPALCDGVSCWDPPANRCVGTNLEVFDPAGYCIAGSCEYVSRVETCDQGTCASGVCSGSPCQGVYCLDPPDNYCFTEKQVRSYDHAGYCSAGACAYLHQELSCATGECFQGACVDTPCVGVVCDRPPSRFCSSGNTLRVFEDEGTCMSDGACVYGHEDIVCAAGCLDGACVGAPCEGVACIHAPAEHCDGQVRVFYDETGTCNGGFCSYAEHRETCPNGCAQGACESGPDGDADADTDADADADMDADADANA